MHPKKTYKFRPKYLYSHEYHKTNNSYISSSPLYSTNISNLNLKLPNLSVLALGEFFKQM